MVDRKESNGGGGWMSVPAFGDWDQQKDGAVPDYSMDFTNIRETRKQNKKDFARASVGNDEELIDHHGDSHRGHGGDDGGERARHHRDHSPTAKKKIMSYFNCCVIGRA